MSNDTLYEAMRLRSAIFVVEQNCVFHDMDGADPQCEHLCGTDETGRLLAYVRLVPPGLKYPEPSIGRVISSELVRGTGLGRALMREAIAGCEWRYPGLAIVIGAQQRLERFYSDFGFVQVGEPYMEDGIPHIEMRREPTLVG
jgi:ElaA protein